MKTIHLLLLIVIVAVGGFLLWSFRSPVNAPQDNGQPTDANIIVTSPKAGDKVASPITVIGKARVFERTFAYRLKNSADQVIFEDHGMTSGPDLPEYGTFTVKIPVPLGTSGLLTVEVFEYSAKDGEITNLVSIPVVFVPSKTTSVKVHFANSAPSNTDCSVTIPMTRQVSGTNEPGFISLVELLKGPTQEEKINGATTAIQDGTRLNSLVLRNGTAYVDFDYMIDYQVGGSCRVIAIRSQITNTLKQFPSIKDVVISRNGQTADVLQP